MAAEAAGAPPPATQAEAAARVVRLVEAAGPQGLAAAGHGLATVLESGCDDRIAQFAPSSSSTSSSSASSSASAATTQNMYGRSLAVPPPEAVFRASVTCNAPTALGAAAAAAALQRLQQPQPDHGDDDDSTDQQQATTPASSASSASSAASAASPLLLAAHAREADSVRARLAAALALPAEALVCLAPSGTDAEFLPLLAAKALAGGGGEEESTTPLSAPPPPRKFVSIVAAQGEIGRGSRTAAGGNTHRPFAAQHHAFAAATAAAAAAAATSSAGDAADLAEIGPLGEDGRASPDSGVPITGLATGVRVVSSPAREGPDGTPIDHAPFIARVLAEDKDEVPIVHVVAGTKTGVIQPLPDEATLSAIRARNGLVVVDACQMRFTLEQVASWLAADCIVMVTGSKFFRSPPFNAAVILPPGLAARLQAALATGGRHVGPRVPSGLRAFFTAHDLPQELDVWRQQLSNECNAGLLLRWAATLAEIEATYALPAEHRAALCTAWRHRTVGLIATHGAPLLEAVFGDSDNTSTNIAVRVRNASAPPGEGPDTWLSAPRLEELTPLLEPNLTAALARIGHAVPAATDDLDARAARTPCYVGQRVDPGPGVSAVVRIAIASDTVRELNDDADAVAEADTLLVRKLALVAKHFDALLADAAKAA